VAGTDAHYGPQIGYGYTVIDAKEATVEAVVRAIVEGYCQARGRQVPMVLNVQQQFQRLKRMVKKTALELS
jgi:predicted metal-dependent phosphoesterase TrpH